MNRICLNNWIEDLMKIILNIESILSLKFKLMNYVSYIHIIMDILKLVYNLIIILCKLLI